MARDFSEAQAQTPFITYLASWYLKMEKASEYYVNFTVVALRRSGIIVPHFEFQIERSDSMATHFERLTEVLWLWKTSAEENNH